MSIPGPRCRRWRPRACSSAREKPSEANPEILKYITVRSPWIKLSAAGCGGSDQRKTSAFWGSRLWAIVRPHSRAGAMGGQSCSAQKMPREPIWAQPTFSFPRGRRPAAQEAPAHAGGSPGRSPGSRPGLPRISSMPEPKQCAVPNTIATEGFFHGQLERAMQPLAWTENPPCR